MEQTEVSKKAEVPGLFDFLDALGVSKKYLIDSPENENAFNPWMTAVAFSQHQDTIFIANMANEIYQAPKHAIYNFYHEVVPKKKRFGKWAKKPIIDDSTIEIACQLFGWSKRRAPELIKVLDKQQLLLLKSKLDKGGYHGKERSASDSGRT